MAWSMSDTAIPVAMPGLAPSPVATASASASTPAVAAKLSACSRETRLTAVAGSMTPSRARSTAMRTAAAAERFPARDCRT